MPPLQTHRNIVDNADGKLGSLRVCMCIYIYIRRPRTGFCAASHFFLGRWQGRQPLTGMYIIYM
jgi:hypothetical protein